MPKSFFFDNLKLYLDVSPLYRVVTNRTAVTGDMRERITWMNDPKILFVKQFLARLSQEKVETIPINNALFKSGIENMAQYFVAHKQEFGPYVNKLELLFLKYSTRGEYRQFAKVIESFNGRIVSLENPYYVKANIRLEEPYAEELVHNEELGIDAEVFVELVENFKKGAELS